MAYIPAPQPLALGGTAAITALAAKSALQVTALATDQTTLTTAMVMVGYTSSQAVTLPAASGANPGQPIRCYNATTAGVTLTLSRAGSDTIAYDAVTGATSAAIDIPVGGAIMLVRESSSVWRVVQPSSVSNPLQSTGVEVTATQSSSLPAISVSAL